MAFLINRTAAARIECLHALAKLILNKFGAYSSFYLNDVKFVRNDINIFEYCTLLKNDDMIGCYCRFKENPLDDAGCAITNGKFTDTTKSKEVSNTINAMHALGFVKREGRKVRLTSTGTKFAKTDYNSEEMTYIIKKAVLNYGPIVGILNQLSQYKIGECFDASNLHIGYPNPIEKINYNGSIVELSAGSTKDTNTRTKSCILAWLTTAGYIKPLRVHKSYSSFPQIAYREYINSAHRMEQNYEIVEKPIITNTAIPLDYNNLIKKISCLRENGQDIVREATSDFEAIIKNRRFAIIYILNKAFINGEELSFNELIQFFRKHPKYFIASDCCLEETIATEIEIAFMAGIPYSINSRNSQIYIKPQQGINIEELQIGVPKEILNVLKTFK